MKKKYILFVALSFILCGIAVLPQDLKASGIIVDSLEKGSAGEKAGLMPGDILISWKMDPNPPANPKGQTGFLRSPFDLWYIEMEKAPRGTMELFGKRGSDPLSWTMPAGIWKINARPMLSKERSKRYDEGAGTVSGNDPGQSIEIFSKIADEIRESDIPGSAWLYCRIAAALDKAGKRKESTAYYDKALSIAGRILSQETRSAVCYLLGTSLRNQSRFDEAIFSYREHIRLETAMHGENMVVANALNQIGGALFRKGDLDSAEASLKKAFAIAERCAPGSLAFADCLNKQGIVAKTRDDFDSAEDYFRKAFDLYAKINPDSLEAAAIINNLGVAAQEKGDLALAEKYHRQALDLKEKIAPGSLDAAASYNNLGVIARQRGDLAQAEKLYLSSLEIKLKNGAENLDLAIAYNNLGNIASDRGNLALSEEYLRKSLAITSKLAPGSLDESRDLGNLGVISQERGDLESSEEYHKRELEITSRLAPGSLDEAYALNSLGNIECARGRLELSRDYHLRALAIREKLAPGSMDMADSLNNLGVVSDELGDQERELDYYKRALQITMKEAPESVDAAMALNNLGAVENDRGDPDAALGYYERSLELIGRLAPGSIAQSVGFGNTGLISYEKGDLEAAMRDYTASLDIIRKMAPGSANEAEAFHSMGKVFRKQNKLDEAVVYFCNAVSSLESQKGRLGGGREVRDNFASKYSDYYRDLAEVQALLGRNEDALDTMEKFRARGLLEMLAERDLDFTRDAPAELVANQKELVFDYSTTQEELALLSPETDGEEIAALRKKLDDIAAKEDENRQKIIAAAPGLASLQYPAPLRSGAVAELLGPGVLLLSYSTGAEGTRLLAVLNGKVTSFPLPVGRRTLRNLVAELRRTLTDPSSPRKLLDGRSSALYSLLLQPAGKLIGKADLVIICPDGPLHYLPFGSLEDGKNRPLAERKPLVNVISATVLKELLKGGLNGRKGLLALGDPLYSSTLPDGTVVRSSTSDGEPFAPLPATKAEVDSIGSIFGGTAKVLTGADATKDNAIALGKEYPVIHFACHGILNEKVPLDSGLALSIQGRSAGNGGNGILHAWEIFEGLRINADLVTLSACETGLGKEMGGEGMIGLTRAFQYAGARTVLSSLWRVSDESTAILMKNFYLNLKAGKNKAEALRLAQVEMMKDKLYSHPFFWGGFVLNGDWR